MPVNPFDSFHTWRESTDPTFSNSLDYFTCILHAYHHEAALADWWRWQRVGALAKSSETKGRIKA